MTLNAWNGLPDPEAPKNLREGEPYNDPKFEELARTYGIWGTAQAALCAQFWQAARRAPAAPVQLPEPAAVVLSKFGTTCMFPSTEINKGAKLYTEQQVLAILAQHGIKTK